VSAIATHGTRYLAGPVALGTDPLRPLCILRRAESGPETTSQRAYVGQLAGTRGFLRFSAGDRACCGRGRRLRAVKALYRPLTTCRRPSGASMSTRTSSIDSWYSALHAESAS